MSTKIEILETRLGKGKVHDTIGHLVGTGQYEVHVVREVHESPDGVLRGIEEIEGIISGVDALNCVGDPLLLTLEDGRKLEFLLSGFRRQHCLALRPPSGLKATNRKCRKRSPDISTVVRGTNGSASVYRCIRTFEGLSDG